MVMSPAANPGAVVCPLIQTSTDIITHFPDSQSDLIMLVLGCIPFNTSLIHGWIVERSGLCHSFQLELEVPLSDREGEELLGLFLTDRTEDPLGI